MVQCLQQFSDTAPVTVKVVRLYFGQQQNSLLSLILAEMRGGKRKAEPRFTGREDNRRGKPGSGGAAWFHQ